MLGELYRGKYGTIDKGHRRWSYYVAEHLQALGGETDDLK